VLDRMAANRFLYVPYIYQKALVQVERILKKYSFEHENAVDPITFKESHRASLQEALGKLSPDPAMDNLRDINSILENAFIIKMIEAYPLEQRKPDVES